jgi:hypothetical protein
LYSAVLILYISLLPHYGTWPSLAGGVIVRGMLVLGQLITEAETCAALDTDARFLQVRAVRGRAYTGSIPAPLVHVQGAVSVVPVKQIPSLALQKKKCLHFRCVIPVIKRNCHLIYSKFFVNKICLGIGYRT